MHFDIYYVGSKFHCSVSVFIEIDTFMQQGCVKLVKSESKDIYKVSKFIFQIKAVLLNFLFIKSWIKRIMVPTKYSSTSVFNIDNSKKYFLSSKLEWFLKIGVM